MTGEIIKSFLVGLGFDVDDASLAKFNKAVASATLRVTALYGAVKILAAGVAFGITKISDSFEDLGYEYKILAPAINKALILRQELIRAYASAGINLAKTAQAAVRLNISITKTKYVLEAIYKSVGARFFELLTKQSDIFREKLYKNMPLIQHTLEKLVKVIFKAFEAMVALGSRLWSILMRVYELFSKLNRATDGWAAAILLAVAAWKLLNLGFLATPLGLLLSGFVALLALWDDFKTFREGGQSLINWGSDFAKTLIGVGAAIAVVAGAITALRLIQMAYNAILAITDGLVIVLSTPLWAIVAVLTAIIAALALADEKWKIFGGRISNFFGGIGGKVMDFLGGGPANIGANLQNNPGLQPSQPLGAASAQNSLTNQNVSQQTNINIMGSADANSVGKTVAGEQGRVNFDLTRNLKGATR